MQGQLPFFRMQVYAILLTNTGLDYFGPVMVTMGRRQEKRWMFTCLMVRAVHLELPADLSTDTLRVALVENATRKYVTISIYRHVNEPILGEKRRMYSHV